MDKKVSVLMAAYNAQDTVATAIKSILDQTYSNFEFIIADDGSEDNTRAIIENYRKLDSRIICFHNEQNVGLLHTWNHLIGKSSGELITWQDADDQSYPERLERMVSAFDKDPELMICGSNYSRTLEPWGITLRSNLPATYEDLIKAVRIENKLLFLGGTRMIRHELLKEYPKFRTFFDRIGWEDKDYILRVSEKYKIINLSDVLYEYRYSRASASRALSDERYLKLYVEEIGFFLARQRWQNGVDGLMDGGNKGELDSYLEGLKVKFEQDKSVLYRRACVNKLNNRDYFCALKDAFGAVKRNMWNISNYLLVLRVIVSFILFYIKFQLRKY